MSATTAKVTTADGIPYKGIYLSLREIYGEFALLYNSRERLSWGEPNAISSRPSKEWQRGLQSLCEVLVLAARMANMAGMRPAGMKHVNGIYAHDTISRSDLPDLGKLPMPKTPREHDVMLAQVTTKMERVVFDYERGGVERDLAAELNRLQDEDPDKAAQTGGMLQTMINFTLNRQPCELVTTNSP